MELPGILTTLGASRHCVVQAKILGQTLDAIHPGVPRAVIGRQSEVGVLASFGWEVIATEDQALQRGFESKLHLWRYSPFESTLFLDVDILPLPTDMPILKVIDGLLASEAPVSFYARRMDGEGEYQGTRVRALRKRGIERLWATRAGGHYFWRRNAAAREVFELAQRIGREAWPEILRFRPAITGAWHTPDEVLTSVALALLCPGASLPEDEVFVEAQQWLATRPTGARFVHFIADTCPLAYHRLAATNQADRRLCYAATGSWFVKMAMKTAFHYARGGRKRVKTSQTAEPLPTG